MLTHTNQRKSGLLVFLVCLYLISIDKMTLTDYHDIANTFFFPLLVRTNIASSTACMVRATACSPRIITMLVTVYDRTATLPYYRTTRVRPYGRTRRTVVLLHIDSTRLLCRYVILVLKHPRDSKRYGRTHTTVRQSTRYSRTKFSTVPGAAKFCRHV